MNTTDNQLVAALLQYLFLQELSIKKNLYKMEILQTCKADNRKPAIG